MKKQNLFFDFDGMKFNTLPALVAYVNHRYEINTLPSEYIGNNDSLDVIIKKHSPNVNLSWEDIYIDVGKNFHSSIEWHEEVKPMDGMCEVISLLSSKYKLFTVTARQKPGINVIQHLLDEYIPGCISHIHCAWEHHPVKGFIETSKRDFILSVNGENIAFFDDSLNEIKKTADIIPSYLFDEMNIHENSGIENRINHWERIGEMFL